MRGLRCSKSVVSYARAGSSLRGSRSCASGTRVFRIPLCLMFGCKVGCVEWARGGMVVGEMCHICIGRMCVERVLCHKPVVRPSIPAASASRDLCVCFPVAQCPRECGLGFALAGSFALGRSSVSECVASYARSGFACGIASCRQAARSGSRVFGVPWCLRLGSEVTCVSWSRGGMGFGRDS